VNRTAAGVALATTTALAWGGQFVVGKAALASVDPFTLTTVRYALAAGVLVALLMAVEGLRALRLDGRGLRLLWLGTVGFAGFNLLAYTGLQHAEPQSAALITALGPLLTALVLWQRTRVRPGRTTLALMGLALGGVTLVISGGDPASILDGSVGWGNLLVLGGVLSFVVYTLGAAEFTAFSALRYTALTAALGWLSIAGLTVAAVGLGLEPGASPGEVWSVAPELLYISLLGGSIAVVTWNGAVGKLGAQNAALFTNLIPVTTFAIEIARGYRPGPLELAGAGITLAALVASNLLGRRRARGVRGSELAAAADA
jgi:drug/metabolite transporter (DMT)-like permease